LLGDPQTRRRLGAAARLEVERHFSVGVLCAAHADLYAAVASEARAALGRRAPVAGEPWSAPR
jgi:hypothetical protein